VGIREGKRKQIYHGSKRLRAVGEWGERVVGENTTAEGLSWPRGGKQKGEKTASVIFGEKTYKKVGRRLIAEKGDGSTKRFIQSQKRNHSKLAIKKDAKYRREKKNKEDASREGKGRGPFMRSLYRAFGERQKKDYFEQKEHPPIRRIMVLRQKRKGKGNSLFQPMTQKK